MIIMKKNIFLMLALLSVIVFCGGSISAEEKNSWTLKFTDIEGERASCEVYISENEELFSARDKSPKESSKLLFPLRTVAECLGAKVEWKPESGNIILDFDTEKWVIYQPKSYYADDNFYKKWKIFWGENDIFFKNLEEKRSGYSDISGRLIGFELVLELINDINYMDIYGLESMAESFRSTVTIDEENRIVEVFTLPNPFYCGKVFEETKVKVDNGKGNIKEISALMDENTIKAISLDDFMAAIGGESVEYVDEYTEKDEDYLEGFNPLVYRTYKYKDNLFLFSYNKQYYWFDKNTQEGSLAYRVRNVSRDTTESISFIRQDEYRNNIGIDGLCYLYNNEVYIRSNNAKYMLKFCGYEFIEDGKEIYIYIISDELDEGLYKVMYK